MIPLTGLLSELNMKKVPLSSLAACISFVPAQSGGAGSGARSIFYDVTPLLCKEDLAFSRKLELVSNIL